MSKRKYRLFGIIGNTNQCTATTKSGKRCKNFWKKLISRPFCSQHWISYKKELQNS